MGHRVVVAVTLPLLGQLGLDQQGQGQGQGLAQRSGVNPASAPGQGPGLLPYQHKQREAAELAAMTRAGGVAPASGHGLGMASGSRLGRDVNTTTTSSSASFFALKRAYAAMWRNTLLSSQPRFQDLPVLPLTPANAHKLALALCPEGTLLSLLCPPLHCISPPPTLSN